PRARRGTRDPQVGQRWPAPARARGRRQGRVPAGPPDTESRVDTEGCPSRGRTPPSIGNTPRQTAPVQGVATAPIGRTRGSGGPRRALRGTPSPSLVGNPRTVHTDAMRKIMISGLHPLGWMLLAAACNTADGGRGSGDASEG